MAQLPKVFLQQGNERPAFSSPAYRCVIGLRKGASRNDKRDLMGLCELDDALGVCGLLLLEGEFDHEVRFRQHDHDWVSNCTSPLRICS